MKKVITLLMGLVLMLALIFAFSACSVTNTELPESSLQNTQDDLEHQTNGDVKTLVVYFSAPDNLDNSYVEIDGERLGNTQYMAYVIQENTAADIFRISPQNPYPNRTRCSVGGSAGGGKNECPSGN